MIVVSSVRFVATGRLEGMGSPSSCQTPLLSFLLWLKSFPFNEAAPTASTAVAVAIAVAGNPNDDDDDGAMGGLASGAGADGAAKGVMGEGATTEEVALVVGIPDDTTTAFHDVLSSAAQGPLPLTLACCCCSG